MPANAYRYGIWLEKAHPTVRKLPELTSKASAKDGHCAKDADNDVEQGPLLGTLSRLPGIGTTLKCKIEAADDVALHKAGRACS